MNVFALGSSDVEEEDSGDEGGQNSAGEIWIGSREGAEEKWVRRKKITVGSHRKLQAKKKRLCYMSEPCIRYASPDHYTVPQGRCYRT